MSQNPYAPPKELSPAPGVLSGSHEDVRAVAVYQRILLVWILVYIIASIFVGSMEEGKFEQYKIIFYLIAGFLGLAVAAFIFFFTSKFYGTGIAIVMGVLALIPVLGFLILVVVNGKATKVLRDNGYKVGFLGAKAKSE